MVHVQAAILERGQEGCFGGSNSTLQWHGPQIRQWAQLQGYDKETYQYLRYSRTSHSSYGIIILFALSCDAAIDLACPTENLLPQLCATPICQNCRPHVATPYENALRLYGSSTISRKALRATLGFLHLHRERAAFQSSQACTGPCELARGLAAPRL